MSIGETLFSFEGRIGRGAFWATFIFQLIVGNASYVLISISNNISIVVLGIIIFVVLGWITLAIYTKRWHDLDKSGWMNLTLLIPLINLIIVLYLGIAAGTTESNRFW